MTASPPTLARELAAAIDWWHLAGVDLEFEDDVTAWLIEDAVEPTVTSEPAQGADPSANVAAEAREIPQKSAPNVSRIDLLGESPPATLEDFHRFWLEAPGLDAIGPRGRIAPRGKGGAELMVLVVDPEERDKDRLLSGPEGELLTNILSAIGMSEDDVYLASALPRHTPMADTAAIAQSGMDEVLLHHIKLAAPKKIIAFGANVLPLLGFDQAQDAISSREINQGSTTTPLLVSERLDSLMSMTRLKARFWRRWMGWAA